MDLGTPPAAVQAQQPGSLLALYRRLIALRQGSPALVAGDIAEVTATGMVLTFTRGHAGQQLRILLNMGSTPSRMPVPAGRLLLSTRDGPLRIEDGHILLAADEGVILDETGL